MSDKIERHLRLVNSMSRKVGVDLGRRVVEGTMAAADLSDVIVTCTRCGNVAACEDFFCSDADRDGGGGEVPDYCANGLLFSKMKPDQ